MAWAVRFRSVSSPRSSNRTCGFPASTRRMVTCPEAIKAQNSLAAVSALGGAHWVFTRRLNSPCRRSMALVIRKDFHC